MIESEAKTKWCPFVRFTHPYRGSHRRWNNRGNELKDGADDGAYCIGSECMAWQATDNKFDPQAPGESEKPGKPAGYCGLVK